MLSPPSNKVTVLVRSKSPFSSKMIIKSRHLKNLKKISRIETRLFSPELYMFEDYIWPITYAISETCFWLRMLSTNCERSKKKNCVFASK